MTRKELAYQYGVEAFRKGLKCASFHDKEFCAEFPLKFGDPNTVIFEKEWQKGWVQENLKQPL